MNWQRRACLILALGWAGRVSAQPIEVITLRYRRADEVLPVLRPFVEPGGALTGQGNQLFVRVSSANRRQLEQLLAQIDRAPRQLIISVRQDRSAEGAERQLGAHGSVTYSSRGAGVNGTVTARDERTVGTRNLEQSVRVLEGGRATLTMGVAVPFTFRRWLPQSDGGWIDTQQTVYYEALSGFQVRPTVAGDLVTLEISPEESTGQPSGSSERMRLATQVQVRLGEWVALGGAQTQDTQNTRGLLSLGSSAQSGQRGVWVKVELAQ